MLGKAESGVRLVNTLIIGLRVGLPQEPLLTCVAVSPSALASKRLSTLLGTFLKLW